MEEACGPKVHPSPCLATVIPPSWAALAIIGAWARRGCSLAAVMCGHSKAISWWVAERVNQHCPWAKECLSRSPPTAILPSLAGGEPRARGYSPVAAVPGASKAGSSSALALWEKLAKACRWRCRQTVIPLSWEGGPTTARPGRHGCSPAVAVSGRSKAKSSSALTLQEEPAKAHPSRYPLTATPRFWVDLETTGGID